MRTLLSIQREKYDSLRSIQLSNLECYFRSYGSPLPRLGEETKRNREASWDGGSQGFFHLAGFSIACFQP